TSRVTGHAPRPPRRGLSCLDWPCAAGTPSRGALPVLRSPGPVRATSTATGRLLGVLLLTGGRQVLGPVRALPSRPTGRGRLWPVPGACAGAPRASAGACKAAAASRRAPGGTPRAASAARADGPRLRPAPVAPRRRAAGPTPAPPPRGDPPPGTPEGRTPSGCPALGPVSAVRLAGGACRVLLAAATAPRP